MNTKLNKSDYLLLVIFYVVFTILQTWDYIENDNALIEYLLDIPITIISSIILILIFIFWLIPRFIVRRKKYLLFVILGLLILIFFGGIEYIVGFWSGGNSWENFPPAVTFVFRAIDYGADSMGFPLGLLLTKKFYEGQKDLADAAKQQKENELKLLRSQMDPHFLFNNLNTLDALIDSDTDKAKEYINRLSLIYRYLIKTKDAEVMELSEEMQLAENYMFLIKTRFGMDYDFKIINNAQLSDKYIPTGAIQTLLENVVKHNKASQNNTIKTTIEVKENVIVATNTKFKPSSEIESFGTGLENLRSRYKLLSSEDIHIINTPKLYKISIPIIKLSNDS